MSRGTQPFLRFFEPAIDPSLVEDTSRLLDFLNNCDNDRLPRLLQRRDDKGFTLLHYAAESNQPQSLVVLLVKEADPNIRSSPSTNEITPLHVAAKHGNLACLEKLVESGGNPLAKDAKGNIPRDYAQQNGQELCLEFLQKQSAERVQQETEDLQELLLSIQANFESGNLEEIVNNETFKRLFTSSDSPTGNNASTSSSSLLNSKSTSIPKLSPLDNILSRNCNLLNSVGLVTVLNRVTRDIPVFLHSTSLLHAACHYNNIYLVKQLLERSPSLLYHNTSEGYTPLHVAICHGHIEIVQLLIEAYLLVCRQRSASGALPRPKVPSRYAHQPIAGNTTTGHNIYHFTVALNDCELLSLLLQHQKHLGISLNDQFCGYTPLHLAVHFKYSNITSQLLSSGASPNTVLTSKVLITMSASPLAEATTNADKDMVNLLVNNGAEDRRRDALNLCFRHSDPPNVDLIPSLLGSLVKCDEVGTKQLTQTQGRKEGKRLKMGMIDWGNLDVAEMKSEWVEEGISNCPFFVQQGLSSPTCFDYVSSINLCRNKLTSLPVELFHLKNLSILNVSMNELVSLPRVMKIMTDDPKDSTWPCPTLSRLNLSSNHLKVLPEYLFQLPNLTTLDAAHNEIDELSFSMWCSPKLNHLNCSYNQIKTIPTNWPEVCAIYQLVAPSVASPAASVITSPRSKSTSRKISTDFTGNTSSVKADSRLTESTDSDETTSITPARARQTRLYDRLNVCNANLTIEWDTTEGREELFDGLNYLNLSYNLIKTIPPNFPCLCPKLTKLDLSNNQISELALPRAVPSGLRKLEMSNNRLLVLDSYKSHVEALPCTNPKVLSAITDNKILIDPKFFCVHRSHNHLISLDVLNASFNEITEVKLYSPIISVAEGPHSRSGKIREVDVPLLAALASASNKSAESVRHLAKLAFPLLTRLVLKHNNILEVPLSVCEMTNLNSLDLSYNPIIELRPELGKLSNIWDFPLDDLKLISPPHNIIERGKAKDIIGFLWSLLQRARPYHRMKLMVVGKASRGKTTLLKKISEKGQIGRQDNVFISRMNPESRAATKNLATVGIVVSDWTYTKKIQSDQTQTGLRNITFMTWDFGGQEEYYATHQCFLSRRSLYLVVWNVLDGKEGVDELRPWLLNIQARAPHSPVIIVGTHLDRIKKSAQKAELRENIERIERMYGSGSSLMKMKHGFPTIMENLVVSSTTGKNINDLRDRIFNVACNVKENTVAGRAVGGGRNPEYRLLMDQLVPASYLQLEDSVRNIALNLRYRRKPPVLTYKEFRDLIYADARPLIGRDIDEKELEQAVRFLHENGTLIHYDDPFLKELYFVDPQWLSDMLAHIVTVREINPFIKDGVMKIKDFALLFNDKDFPIKWQKEYLRLLTTFEVAVEFKKGKILIPSHLPETKPQIPKFYAPDDTVFLPPLRHTFLLAFVPSGFWPRLMSRVLSDKSIIRLAQVGCGLTDDETKHLKWTKWRTGMVLKFGNLTLLSLEELSGRLFNGAGRKMKIMLDNGRWDEHSLDITVYGVNIEVPDVYPMLRYAEQHPSRSRNSQASKSADFSNRVGLEEIEEGQQQGENGKGSCSGATPTPTVAVTTTSRSMRKWSFTEKIGTVVNKVRSYTTVEETPEEKFDDGFVMVDEDNDSSSSEDGSDEAEDTVYEGKVKRVKEVLRMDDIQNRFEKLTKQRASGFGKTANDHEGNSHVNAKPIPVLTEENNDKMRAGLISKIVDHITLLVEDWFSGVRPRILVVPCPHCSNGLPPGKIPLLRSSSLNPDLRPPSNPAVIKDYPYNARAPTLANVTNTSSQTGNSRRLFWPLGGRRVTEEEVSQEHLTSPDVTFYAFQYDECVIRARDVLSVKCPSHEELPLEFIAPDTLFLSEGKDILLGPDELMVMKDERLGRGAFATVYKAKYKRGNMNQGMQDFEDCVIKALGRKPEHDDEPFEDDDDQQQGVDAGGGPARPKHMNRGALISGFNNLKKELAILSPLKHTNVVQLFGVSIKPLGLVLELAVKGDLKSVLKSYKEAQNHIQPPAIQCVVSQIANGLGYLHSRRIIYRDLKSENILVWAFPSPHTFLSPVAKLGPDSVKVKISDYGISQFVTSQGAKGHVGTPGFMAPEILKYLGKEAYNEKVDIFSYAMVMYELLTFRVPFEHLTPNQANQANESGTRPTLKKKDLPCPVLIRELMVWCWQQEERHRPSASNIIEVAKANQFLRLADAIRLNNFGSQVTGSCCRIVKSSYQKNATTPVTPAGAFFSPKYSSYTSEARGGGGEVEIISSNQYQRTVQTISSTQPYRPIVDLVNRSYSLGGVIKEDEIAEPLQITAEIGKQLESSENRGLVAAMEESTSSTTRVTFTSSSEPKRKPHVMAMERPHVKALPASLPPLNIKGPVEDELSQESEDDYKMYQVWVASCFTHCSVVTVTEYCGQFVKIEDIDLGDSPVLCIAMVRDTVWIGFQIGYLCIYDANTYNLLAQVWLRQGTEVLSIVYIPQLSTVYVGLADGSVRAFNDVIDQVTVTDDHSSSNDDYTATSPSVISTLDPIMTYHDVYQSTVTLLPVAINVAGSDTRYELWVGQKRRHITVLDASTLSVIDFIDSSMDKSTTPRYLKNLPFAYLTCNHEYDGGQGNGNDDQPSSEGGTSTSSSIDSVLVYGALKHGQYISCWDANTKHLLTCLNCLELSPQCYLYVGLVSGEVLVLGASSLSLFTTLHCHRSHVRSFLPIDLQKLLPPTANNSSSAAFTPSLSPLHPFLMTDYNSVTFKTGPSQLMSFGTGFRAYYESKDSIDYSKSSFALVWEAADWKNLTHIEHI